MCWSCSRIPIILQGGLGVGICASFLVRHPRRTHMLFLFCSLCATWSHHLLSQYFTTSSASKLLQNRCLSALHFFTVQYNTYLIDRSPVGLFRANETQPNDGTEQQLLRIPTGRRQTSWLFTVYKYSWEVEPGITRIKFNEWSERVLSPRSPDFKASALTTGPHCVRIVTDQNRLF